MIEQRYNLFLSSTHSYFSFIILTKPKLGVFILKYIVLYKQYKTNYITEYLHHKCLFGSIVDKEMYLSAYGQIVAEEWNKSFEIRQELFCDAFVIMPNHIHAILRIEYPTVIVEPHGRAALRDADVNIDTDGRASDDNNGNSYSETHGRASDDDNSYYETHSRASLPGVNGVAFREPQSISSFVAGFKSAVTVRINTLRQTKGQPVWQTRFHDHVIRDYEECRRIGAYIDMNIANWNDDRYYVQ